MAHSASWFRIRSRSVALAAAGLTCLSTAAALAEEAAPVIDTGDTAWVLTASALVLMMTLPGLALFYGGLVRAKNVLNVLMQCFLSAGIVGVLWILVGYSLAFGTGNAFIGDLSKVGLAGVTLDSVTANFASPPRNIPEYVFIMFQAMFAIITPGADPRRDRRAHEVQRLGRVHHHLAARRLLPDRAHGVGRRRAGSSRPARSTSPAASSCTCRAASRRIVAAIMLGKRRGFGKEPMPPHSLPLCLIGAGLLWTGWFGFNAGSALSASPLAALAFLNTSTAASTAVVAWALDRVAPPRQADGARRRHRGGRGPRRDHAGLRQRVADGRDRDRHRRLGHLVRGLHVPEAGARLRRLARRLRRARARRRLGRARLGHLRRHARLGHREQRAADHGAAAGHRLRRGLRADRDRRHPRRPEGSSSARCASTTRTRSRASTSSQHSESAYGFAGGSMLAPEATTQGRPLAMAMIAHPEH